MTLAAHICGFTAFLRDSTDLDHSFPDVLSGTLLTTLNLAQPPIILETIDLIGCSTDSGAFFQIRIFCKLSMQRPRVWQVWVCVYSIFERRTILETLEAQLPVVTASYTTQMLSDYFMEGCVACVFPGSTCFVYFPSSRAVHFTQCASLLTETGVFWHQLLSEVCQTNSSCQSQRKQMPHVERKIIYDSGVTILDTTGLYIGFPVRREVPILRFFLTGTVMSSWNPGIHSIHTYWHYQWASQPMKSILPRLLHQSPIWPLYTHSCSPPIHSPHFVFHKGKFLKIKIELGPCHSFEIILGFDFS